MFSSLCLENFKAFGKKVKIPLAPITLLFGENSAGKSTILQALNLLKQTRESREAGGLLLPRTEKGIVDLGSFHEFIFDHDLNRSLSIGVEVELPLSSKSRLRERYLFGSRAARKVGLQMDFQRPASNAEVSLAELKVFLGDSDNPVAVFESTTTPKGLRMEAFRVARFVRDSIPKDLRAVKCKWITSDESFWKPAFQSLKEFQARMVSRLREELKTGKFSGMHSSLWMDQINYKKESKQQYLDRLKDIVSFYSSDFTLSELSGRLQAQQIGMVIGLDGFVPIIAKRSSASPIMDEHLVGEFPDWNRFGRPTADIGRITIAVGRVVDEEIRKLFPMGPSRRSPERWYIFTGTSPQDVGYQGDSMPDFLFRNPDVVKNVNSWLDRLQIGYRLQTRSLGPRIRDLFEVRLTDTRRRGSVKVGLPDVGFGISQLLPFIVQALASEKQTISIEQPEVHVHPRLQADIGDLLAECARERNNQFLIETHSEHLVLRLQKLIRIGTLRPEEVSIIYVWRGREGAEVQRLQLDEEGDFMDEWPGGFFPERLRELS